MQKALLSRLSLVGGIIVVLVGLVHVAFTPAMYRSASHAVPERAIAFSYFFAVMGLYVVLCGWLMIYCSRPLARGERWALAISVANGACNVVAGVGALAAGFSNPFLWAWFLVSVALTLLAALSARAYPARS